MCYLYSEEVRPVFITTVKRTGRVLICTVKRSPRMSSVAAVRRSRRGPDRYADVWTAAPPPRGSAASPGGEPPGDGDEALVVRMDASDDEPAVEPSTVGSTAARSRSRSEDGAGLSFVCVLCSRDESAMVSSIAEGCFGENIAFFRS